MAFTAGELANIANATLDFHLRNGVHSQVKQDRPLLAAMEKAQKKFPGGKELITGRVKGKYTSGFAGYTHDDQVSFGNPANIEEVAYPWFEQHAGIGLTFTELKKGGITVVDTQDGSSVESVTESEKVQLANLMDDKLEDLSEGSARSQDALMHGDGSGDAKALAGVQAFIAADPTTGVVGTINRATVGNEWWRNRARTTAHETATGNSADGPIPLSSIAKTIHSEMRQLRRYGGRPNLIIAGSTFLDLLSEEIRAKGNYTDEGFSRTKNTQIGLADIYYNNLQFVYDPQLDDLSLETRCYILDTKHLHPRVMVGEDWRSHSPARPHNKFVLYRSLTWTGGLYMDQANCHGVYDAATS